MLTTDELAQAVADGSIDTVIVAFTDMQGRLMGKRLHGEFFVDEVGSGHAVEGCNYLLALEMEMDPVPGYEIASWERGYGDFVMRPDFDTLCRTTWLDGTAMCLADVEWEDGSPVVASPRQVLRALRILVDERDVAERPAGRGSDHPGLSPAWRARST